MARIIYAELSYKINGILYKVHNELGNKCNELQYGDCIEKYLKEQNIHFVREICLPKTFEGEEKGRNKADFLIENIIIVEIKAKRIIEKEDYYQVQRYLRALNKKLGILVNFRNNYLHPKRILNSQANE